MRDVAPDTRVAGNPVRTIASKAIAYRGLQRVLRRAWDLALRPDVAEMPTVVNEAERLLAKLDWHGMVDGQVPPALVQESVLAIVAVRY